ncbi:proteasome complex subunit Rpn13 ubiquitin receptor-domain-containing protein [Geranomyces variabilis]|nr:proteasome complex subunit Rpn13 ubiquitin receptor-domain-containing protein [Geranomyces variabilis]KAJ3131277.1 adhesion regulating molecule 1 [Geranomyces variabilis]
MATIPSSLFGSSSQQQPQNLVQFRAGKCSRSGTTVTPEARKGLLYMNQGEDGLLHFFWKDRRTGAIEDDLIIFQDEADFEKVTQSTGRVYVLKFKSSSQKLFFWMQEPNADKDEELIAKVNSLINNPPSSGDDLAQAFAQSQREDTPASPGGTPSQLEQIRRILANISVSDREAETTTLTPELVGPILSNAEISSVLFPNLPYKAFRTNAELEDVMNSPSFRQSAQSLSAALRQGQLTEIIQQLGGENFEALHTFLLRLQERTNSAMDTD